MSAAVVAAVRHVTYAQAGNVQFVPQEPSAPVDACENWSACAATATTQPELAQCAATVSKCMPSTVTGAATLDFNGTTVPLAAVHGTTAMCGKAGATWYVLTKTPAGATVFAASERTGTVSAATGANDKWTVASLASGSAAPAATGPAHAACAIEACIASLEGIASCSAAARACVATTESAETLEYDGKKVKLFAVGKARYGKEGPYVIQADGNKGKMLVVGEKPLVVDVELSDSTWKLVEGTNWIVVGVVIGIVVLAGIVIVAMLYKNQTSK
jgi:hypothetical protein